MNITQVDLSEYSSLKIGGKGNMVTVYSLEELRNTVIQARNAGYTVMFLGEGTNTFFSDDLVRMLVIRLAANTISHVEDEDYYYVTGDAGVIWDDFVAYTVDRKMWGLENLSLIPGTVGASPIQNIGAYGVELADVFSELVAYDTQKNEVVTFFKEMCGFGYRDSVFKKDPSRYCIISVTCKLSKSPRPVLGYKPLDSLAEKKDITQSMIRDLVIATRQSKLPDYRLYPNTGSFFKNPIITPAQAESLRAKYPEVPLFVSNSLYKVPAAWLIEHVAEMKGARVGNIGVWEHQPLVIVNYGGVTSEELLTFSERIIAVVREKTGIILEKEVNYIE